MEHNLTVAVIPLPIVWADRDANLRAAAEAIHSLPAGVDIAVLPELFSTGFISDPGQMQALADTPGQPVTARFLLSLARECNLAICAGILAAAPDGRGFVNSAVFAEPGGELTVYAKRHLFSLSRESRILSPGRERIPLLRFRGWDISFSVCYDLRFPAWLRNDPARPYDLMIIPANWPEEREHAWTHLLIARAIENQAYIVGANRSGSDPFGTYNGMTRIFNPLGHSVETTSASADDPLAPVIATLTRRPLDKLRASFPVLSDADPLAFL